MEINRGKSYLLYPDLRKVPIMLEINQYVKIKDCNPYAGQTGYITMVYPAGLFSEHELYLVTFSPFHGGQFTLDQIEILA